jgi:hypothetical protein
MDANRGQTQDHYRDKSHLQKFLFIKNDSQLYWVMTGDDFSLDINNKRTTFYVLCIDRQNIYSAALSLYNSRIVKLINKRDSLKFGYIDRLPTIYFRGLITLLQLPEVIGAWYGVSGLFCN